MEYRSKDFEDLFLNVYEVPVGQDLFKVFSILDHYPIFKLPITDENQMVIDALPIQKVIRYIVYAFDHKTPLLNVPDILERRVNAAFLAGFEHGPENTFHEEIEKMLRSQQLIVNKMVIQYAIIQANDDYVAMVAYQDTLRRKSLDLIDADETLSEEKTINIIESCRKNIASIRQQLLTTDKDDLLNRSLYMFQEAQRLKLRPEDIADALMEDDPTFREMRGH